MGKAFLKKFAFNNRYPSIGYSRYIHEVYISYSPGLREEELSLLLETVDLSGDIVHIKRGEPPVLCLIGDICIDDSGKIKYNIRN